MGKRGAPASGQLGVFFAKSKGGPLAQLAESGASTHAEHKPDQSKKKRPKTAAGAKQSSVEGSLLLARSLTHARPRFLLQTCPHMAKTCPAL